MRTQRDVDAQLAKHVRSATHRGIAALIFVAIIFIAELYAWWNQ